MHVMQRAADAVRRTSKALVAQVRGIVSHLEIHDDELMAHWFLRTFGGEKFPGIRNAPLILVDSGMRLLRGKTGAQWLAEGYPCLGTCGGPLDEHELPPAERKNASAATLAAKMLGIDAFAPIKAMLAHTVRVDRTATATSFDISAVIKAMHRDSVPVATVCRIYDRIADAWFTVLSGKVKNPDWQSRPSFNQLAGEWITHYLSPEGSDRSAQHPTALAAADALGFVGIRNLRPLLAYTIAEDLNALHGVLARERLFEMAGIVDALNQDNASPAEIRQIVFTILNAKWQEQLRFMEALQQLELMEKSGKLYVGGTRWRIIRVVSDNSEINRAARHLAENGDIFIQRSTDGHVVIWYNKVKFNMDDVAMRLRMGDRNLRRMPKLPWDVLTAEGTMPEAPWWYYNPANGQIMNGSRTNRGTPVTHLDDNAILQCVVRGLKLAR